MLELDLRLERQNAALGALARHDCFVRADLAVCLRQINRVAIQTLEVARSSIWFLNDDGSSLICADHHDMSSKDGGTGVVLERADFPLYFQAILQDRVIAAADAQADPRTAEFTEAYLIPLGIASMLDAPILFGGRTVGVLCVEHVGLPRGWPRDEQVFTASLGDFVALALVAEERNRTESALRRAEERYRGIFENAIEGLFQMSPEGRFIDVNPAMAHMLGFADAAGFLAARGSSGTPLFVDPGRRAELMRLADVQDRVVGFEAEVYRRDGPIIWGGFSIRAVRGADGEILRLEGSVEDVTARRRAEDQLAHVALHDGLTNLPNRALFMDRLAQSLARARLTGIGSTVVVLIDIDKFSLINDSLGHAAGDRLLIDLAGRLAARLRPGDTLARLAGDEFAVLVEGLIDVDSAQAFAETLRSCVAAPFTLAADQDFFASASAGVVFAMGGEQGPEDLLRHAGTALHQAKAQGRSRCLAFTDEMRTEPLLTLKLQSDMRRAIERDDFVLFYQPVLSLHDRRLVGFEALIRWNHIQRGLIPPATFIPIAEENGLMSDLGDWVTNTACHQMRIWQERVGAATPLSLSVNIAPTQLIHPDVFTLLDRALAASGVDVRRMKLEVTETALAGDAELLPQRLRALRERGFQILIDDFGTGYSSLSRLHRLPIDGLKIDQCFVKPMLYDPDSAAIVRTIIALGKALNLDLFAEGVEDEGSAAELGRMKCEFAQGYHFARPLPIAAADALVDALVESVAAEAAARTLSPT
ncbi:putative bifunctional diguanylate cyclase/phosphodiesterase [Skermanella stibiiresistens]|uniref:putative bifunctional diguanylate cyclase/phosphodiesterase n=1 Tax=Skermanella stibiiresistens TaxID=913326 RepID=UPI0004B8B80F|nr:EAL domain-containing protein [Skermanella stibiiresistens]